MGLDYSYLLYFKREHLWDALHGVAGIAEPHQPPIKIYFPDHKLPVPLKVWNYEEGSIHHDDPEFNFDTVLFFEEDDAIEDYLLLLDRDGKYNYRSPPGEDEVPRVRIGYIYLTIYSDLSQRYPHRKPADDLVLFDFGTTGTRMSMLFYYSTSIRKTFVKLMESHQGVCGMFNKEDGGGELFWFQGHKMSEDIEDAYMLPEEIEATLEKRRK